MNSKKPLKFTPRVKRMIASDIVLCVLFIAIPAAVLAIMGLLDTQALKIFPLGAFLLLLTGLQKIMIISAEILLSSGWFVKRGSTGPMMLFPAGLRREQNA